MSPAISRWVRFNFVGLMGIGVQMGALALYSVVFGLGYLAATALAVETAVLHNFAWHERFTWRGSAHAPVAERARRLLRFHLANGLISIAGNLALVRLLVGWLGLNRYGANLIAIAVCSLANFAASEWYVFRRTAD